MEIQEILSHLKQGKFEIRHEENCDCVWDWKINEHQQEIEENEDGYDCWTGNLLYVNGELIAHYIDRCTLDWKIEDCDSEHGNLDKNERGLFHTLDWGIDDCDKENVLEAIKEKMRPEPYNLTHKNNKRRSLIDWLTELVNNGYKLMRDNNRGFANEYTCILAFPGVEAKNKDWYMLTPEQWADDYLYSGDAATQPYNKVRIVKQT